MRNWGVWSVAVGLCVACAALGQEPKKTPAKVEKKARTKLPAADELADKAKPSVVVIQHAGRQGKQASLGAGFIIDANGLVATNLHVIGEGRPITVLTVDGKRHEVEAVHASDRHLDLAVLRLKTKGLPSLGLADSDAIKTGQPIVVLGHPQGLKNSVVAGVLSGRRDIDGVDMLQIATPIEPGNSGGPVLDSQGRVVGVVTMKSLVTDNLGFAVPAKQLQSLLKKPNPVPMERWVTLGVLDKAEWRTAYGGSWRQRAGRIVADGSGTGFGGRSLCLSTRDTPEKFPYEISVMVKFESETGAAGLVFGGDGDDRHFGFYPSSGKLRFTRFNGPDVYSWKILEEFPTPHFRPGEWNTFKVRVEEKRVIGFVNDQQVLDRAGLEWFGRTAGVAKFRDTAAEFKRFRVGADLAGVALGPDERKRLDQAVAGLLAETKMPDLIPLLKRPDDGIKLLRDRARELSEQAERLKEYAQQVHLRGVLGELEAMTKIEDAKLDLVRGALLLAKLDNEELEIDAYLREVARMAREIRTSLAKNADAEQRVAALNKYLFEQNGFHGSRHDYYSRNNSYLNEVIDDREGLPITLSVLYLELARQLDLKIVGVPLPGHFVVRHEPPGLPPYLIDVFEGGRTMTNREAEEKIVLRTGALPKRKDFQAATKPMILKRMLHNLISVAESEKDTPAMLRYLDAFVTIDPDAHEERMVRAVMRFRAGRWSDALADCDLLLDRADGEIIDLDRVRELRTAIRRKLE